MRIFTPKEFRDKLIPTKDDFKQALPKRFTLEIEATDLGPNMGKPIRVRVGNMEKTFVINKPDSFGDMIFETDGITDTIEIISPNSTNPHEIDSKNSDTRKLGIGLITLKIKE